MKKIPIAKPSCAPDTPSLCPPSISLGFVHLSRSKGSYMVLMLIPVNLSMAWISWQYKRKKRLLSVLVTGFGYTNMPTIIRPGRKLDYVLLCYLALQSWLASVAHSSGAVLFLRVNLNGVKSISLSYRGLLKKTSVDIEIYQLTVGAVQSFDPVFSKILFFLPKLL